MLRRFSNLFGTLRAQKGVIFLQGSQVVRLGNVSQVEDICPRHHELPIFGFDLDAVAIGDQHFEAIVLGMVSDLHLERRDLRKAARALHRARLCHERLGEDLWVVVVEARHAEVLWRGGDVDRALHALDDALPVLRDQLPQGHALFRGRMVEPLLLADRVSDAVGAWVGARQAMEGSGWRQDLLDCAATSARCFAERGLVGPAREALGVATALVGDGLPANRGVSGALEVARGVLATPVP